MEKLISIVIPAKNEELTIAKCIQSAIDALADIESWEIILVDSYSTDNTVQIAKQFPIRILRLKKEWFKSPHAGRYIGTINSSGKYIFFLDADMIVAEGWIEAALKSLDENTKIAGVTGIMFNILPGEPINGNHQIKHPLGSVEYLPGPSIYRKDVLYQANHFNPYFKGNGEREIGCRISKLGYQQLRIDKTICFHFQKKYDLDESLEKSSYFIGVGQFLRAHFEKKNIVEMLTKYRLVFGYFSILIFTVLMVILSIISGNLKVIFSVISVIVMGFIILVLKQRNPKKTIIDLSALTLKSANFVYGFIKKTSQYSDYPVDVEILK